MGNGTDNKEPVISVIIPVYNGANKIGNCLDNLDKQTIKEPFEVLLIDDASPDESGEKIKEMICGYQHPDRFKVIICKENGRAGRARNIGINSAQGDYIVFIDQDDYPDPDMLRVLFELIQNGKYDCSACDIGDKGGNEYHRYPCKEKESLSISEKQEIMTRFGYVFAILVKRQLIIDNLHYFPENLMFEDSLYTYGLIGIVNSMNNTDMLLYYRNEDPEAQTATLTRKKLQDRVATTEQYVRRYRNNVNIAPLMQLINQYAFYYIFLSCTWWMLTIDGIYDKGFYIDCLKKGRELHVNWRDVAKSQCYFGRKKIRILHLIYDLPWIMPVFRGIFGITMRKKG